jgi:hypothetical protein
MNAMRSWGTGSTLHLPLGRLALCLDCETCFEVGSDACPACGIRTDVGLGGPLSRQEA